MMEAFFLGQGEPIYSLQYQINKSVQAKGRGRLTDELEFNNIIYGYIMAEITPPTFTRAAPTGASQLSELDKIPQSDSRSRYAAIRQETTGFFKDRHSVYQWLTDWDHFKPTPASTRIWAFPATEATRNSSGSRTITLPAPQPVLRLQAPSAAAQIMPVGLLPEGAVGGAGLPGHPSRENLLVETERLMKEMHRVVDALNKADPETPAGKLAFDRLSLQRGELDKKITDSVKTYQRLYGAELLRKIKTWQAEVERALASEGTSDTRRFEELQEQITAFIPETECFFRQEIQQLCISLWNQLTNALSRTDSAQNFRRVRQLVNSDRPIMPNQLQSGDDRSLYFLFRELSQELDDQAYMMGMTDISDQEREQTRTNAITLTARVDKIIDLFQKVISRYQRLASDRQYAHQLAEMREVSNKGHRITAATPDGKTQERLRLIRSLNAPSIDTSHLLDMSDEDFQLVFALLSRKPLTDAHKNTLQRNQWQLTDRNDLLVQRGHDRVRVICVGRNYQIIDTASSVVIGTLDRVRWQRIGQQLKQAGLSANDINRQMIIDDFRKFPTTDEQLQAHRAEGIGAFLDIVHQEGSEIVSNPGSSSRGPDDQPALSERLRYQRRYFHKPR